MNYDYLIEIINMILLCNLLLWLFLDNMSMSKKKQLMRCVFLTLVVVIAETGCLLTDNTAPQNRTWSVLFNCIGFGLTPLVLVMESELYTESRGRYFWSYIPSVINGIFVLMSPKNGYIFWVTENNEYMRGPYFKVYLCAFLFSIVLSALSKLASVQTLPSVLSVKIVASNVIVLLGTLYQVFCPQFHITWLGMAIYFSLVYSFLKEMDGLLDQATGLLNKNTFHLLTQQEAYNKPKSREWTVVVFDIDHFKQINDTLGHQQGDEYIRKVAKVLKLTFGNRHQVFRIGGDEFAVILSGISARRVCMYLEKTEQQIRKRQQKDAKFPTVSYGYAFAGVERSMEQAVKVADTRMYECKRQKSQIS